MDVDKAFQFLQNILDEPSSDTNHEQEEYASVEPILTVERVMEIARGLQNNTTADDDISDVTSEGGTSSPESEGSEYIPNETDTSANESGIYCTPHEPNNFEDQTNRQEGRAPAEFEGSEYTPNERQASESAIFQTIHEPVNPEIQRDQQGVPAAGQVRPQKRKRNPQLWKHNVRKRSIAAGEPYVNYKGEQRPGKAIRQECSCKKQCFDLLGPDKLKTVFEHFYKLPTKDVQDAYLYGCVKATPPGRRRPRDGSKGNYRTNTFTYTDNADGREVQVCSKAFVHIHAIGKKRLERIKTSKASSILPTDKRGKHGKQAKKPESIRDQVRDHIKSFPKIQSHYSRHENPNKHYLHENLNVNRMWLLYLEKYEPEERRKYTNNDKKQMKPKVTCSFYKDIFFYEFNLGFGRPKSDTCLTCDRIATCLSNPDIGDKGEFADQREGAAST